MGIVKSLSACIGIDVVRWSSYGEHMTEPADDDQGVWISIGAPPHGGTHMRLRNADGHVVVDAVYVHGPEVTASTLQAVPVSHLALVTNLTGADLYTLLTVIKFGGLGYPVTHETADHEPSLAELRAAAEDAPPELILIERSSDRRRLTRPDGTDPDGFSARVAEAYREYAVQTRAPGVEIAAEAGVPVATARSWIREARRRGHLPEGRKGRAG